MRWPGIISLCICISSWGMFVRSLRTLSHVTEYQIFRPQKLSLTTQQTYPDEVQYTVTIDGENYTLHLEKNRDLLGKHYAVTHYSADGAEVITTPDHQDHCYYHGHVVDVDDSSVSVGLCSGIDGFVRLGLQSYLIEPLGGGNATGEKTDGEEEPRAEGEGLYPEGEGLHAVYKHEHLRRSKRSAVEFYDHGSRFSELPSGLRTEAQTQAQSGRPRTVEVVLVVDNKEYKKYGASVRGRMLLAVNHVDRLYRALGVRVMLVGLELWSDRDRIDVSPDSDKTLASFVAWRQSSLLTRVAHDNAQLVTGVDFEGATVGLAYTSAMCSSNSGGINQDHNDNALALASTITHEMGHNLGMSHDEAHCRCGPSVSARGCVMAENLQLVYPEVFSSCSQQQLGRFLEVVNPSCLLNTPSAERIYGGPVCGNAFLEEGEECDCGTEEECKNACCNASTCTLTPGAQCAEGECCHECQLRQTGSECRPRAGDCDLSEHCTGLSPLCPADAFAQNGLLCNRGDGYCYNGQCPTHDQQCKRKWGPDAKRAADACFQGNWGSVQLCGDLYCSGGSEFPVAGGKAVVVKKDAECKVVALEPYVPNGTKCGRNMVCLNRRCQDVKVYGTDDCSAKCNNQGVCNHERECHCDPGWAPPYCDVKLTELAAEAKLNAVIIGVSVAAVLILVLILVVGALWCKRNDKNNHFPKWQLRSTAGQTNPLFESGAERGSPRQGPPRISQPRFVESSASQAYTPLALSVVQAPHETLNTFTVVPSRPVPQPPRTPVAARPLKTKTEQVARAPMLPPVAPSKIAHSEAKPPPPSRPLPPLTPKLVSKPKPPVPPVKPVSSPWKQNQLTAGKVALKPPTRPR